MTEIVHQILHLLSEICLLLESVEADDAQLKKIKRAQAKLETIGIKLTQKVYDELQ